VILPEIVTWLTVVPPPLGADATGAGADDPPPPQAEIVNTAMIKVSIRVIVMVCYAFQAKQSN